jgi:hypothetical protein
MNSFTIQCLSSALAGMCTVSAMAETSRLHTRLADGAASTVVPPGGTFNVRVSIESDGAIDFNAALFRLVVSVERSEIYYYQWADPFETGGAADFSLEGLTLPAAVESDTLEGPGYPRATADVEFGVFDAFAYGASGPLLDIVLRAPVDAPPGSSFFVVAVPDLFSSGFDLLSVEVGALLVVDIANSGVFGDISGDSVVDSTDLAILLGNWGVGGPGDLDDSGIVDSADLALLIGAWGSTS